MVAVTGFLGFMRAFHGEVAGQVRLSRGFNGRTASGSGILLSDRTSL